MHGRPRRYHHRAGQQPPLSFAWQQHQPFRAAGFAGTSGLVAACMIGPLKADTRGMVFQAVVKRTGQHRPANRSFKHNGAQEEGTHVSSTREQREWCCGGENIPKGSLCTRAEHQSAGDERRVPPAYDLVSFTQQSAAKKRMPPFPQLTWQYGLDTKSPDKLAADLVHLQQRLRPIQDVVCRQEHLTGRVSWQQNKGGYVLCHAR